MAVKQFSKKSLDEAYNFKLSDDLLLKRRLVAGYTIDSQESMDLDDGIGLEITDNGYLLQVSIADVSLPVKKVTELFSEALTRMETKYLPGFNIPMLPKVLSENKLSLMPDGLRPSLTMEIELSKTYEFKSFKIYESSFKNLGKLSYEQFHNYIDLSENNEEFKIFAEIYKIATVLMQNRRNNGALVIYDLLKGLYTNEEGLLVKYEKEKMNKGYIVVQELMIFANKCVAKFCIENEIPMLFRNHEPRLSAPPREDMMAQLQLAISDATYFRSITERSGLWFKSAEYSPKLKGHFGLNESAYTHFTSPIRRLVDLINHQQVRAFVYKDKFPYSQEELIEMSEKINAFILESKEKTANYHREKAIQTAQKELNYLGTEQILSLEHSKLERLIKTAIDADVLHENLEEAIERIIKKQDTDINLFYNLLFRSEKFSDKWNKIRLNVLNLISEKQGLALQILNICKQKEYIQDFEDKVISENDKFYANISIIHNNTTIRNDKQSSAYTKKEALNLAAFRGLILLSGLPNELIEIQFPNSFFECKEAVTNNNEPKKTLSIPNQNFVGLLNEISQTDKNAHSLDFGFSMSGQSHSPVITCRASIVFNNNKIVVETIGKNKKEAKNSAAYQLYNQIKPDTNISYETKQKVISETSNHISELQEMLAANRFRLPEYNFKPISGDGFHKFQCDLEVYVFSKKHEFYGKGSNKKEAKKSAAQFACEKLKELYPDVF